MTLLDHAAIKPDALAVDDGTRQRTFAELLDRSTRVANWLRQDLGLAPDDHAAILMTNRTEYVEIVVGAILAGVWLTPINWHLARDEIAYIVRDSGAKVLFVDEGFEPLAREIGGPRVVRAGAPLDAALEAASDEPVDLSGPPGSTMIYTSGTTGQPKGALYTHRGAYLNAMGLAVQMRLTADSTYLWTLPMFHCNGWCFTWAVTVVAGTHVCLPRFDAVTALELAVEHRVTHLCGAPVVLNDMAAAGEGVDLSHGVVAATGGAPPTPRVIETMRSMGVEVVHLYGLTETYGPSTICEPQPGWAGLNAGEYARMTARQGVRTVNVEGVRVVDDEA